MLGPSTVIAFCSPSTAIPKEVTNRTREPKSPPFPVSSKNFLTKISSALHLALALALIYCSLLGKMASASALTLLPSLLNHGKYAHSRNSSPANFGSLRNSSSTTTANAAGSRIASGKRRYQIIAKAVGEGSDSGSIVKLVKDSWAESEDQIAIVGLGFAGISALWATINLVGAIDKLPVIPSVFEFVGILYSWWFVYRFLLFKPDRAELVDKVKKSLSDVLGK